ncbi:aminotransferase class V-fold PLP-dependent enzyme [Pelagimonas varians]|uniref:Putative cysteine desulfurase n=1 Tax=Pelagimonas varians TaxID=696760 RepID=A0A238KMX2_9RHOB|nr:aminotransferase class V-fold PLP-dependent enzyme [Pelagimonas varians]PYG28905.1 selenocysteine lyase/cysteine desulfurase [Pelagimonas varians]SMX44164.1 putative cysteine desulfurase [Pelagimonas varians]
MFIHPPLKAPFDGFAAQITKGDVHENLRSGLIGEGIEIPGPFGPKPLIYADYVASGRALDQVEDFISRNVLPIYANSHTEASYCGQQMTRMRGEARRIIGQICGAGDAHAVVFTGSGATAGLNRLVHLLGAGSGSTVLIGPYEHHSNILPWRESGAQVIEIPEAPAGGPDMAALEEALQSCAGSHVIGSFSAASNVTGITTDVQAVTALLKKHGALAVWDYAGGGPYMPIEMGDIDAVVTSPHKFIGGPGASGVMILRLDAVRRQTPSLPGGGTVSFVSPWGHDYSADIAAREEAGTPNVIGDMRAALSFLVKDAIGQGFITQRLQVLRARALTAWASVPGLTVLGNPQAPALPIFSFQMRDSAGVVVHQQLVTRMLSDAFGIQARGGCACAGPYAHRLLGIEAAQSQSLRAEILSGQEVQKPGWTRLGFSPLMTDAKADQIIQAVVDLAADPHAFSGTYQLDPQTARFRPKAA